ncbi:S-adenosyl-L-methionine-dependent methyltransferases superfamily protein [Actinidia rufa]|uniref:S-adenosyl-L-methionine-dependent methyltransferases superfamily protein n=1 Tax=Actinidia rufa TaxID=165716 RepID=A0A7J0FQD2_9ERIC|nr:S-adenosyl-L-methionine-dependent methyltransferases superfamily protein [Actinidia rufa]
MSENFYVRGNGTRAFYFSDEFLMSLFNENGFDIEEQGLLQTSGESVKGDCKLRWVHAVFRLNLANSLHCTNPGNELGCEEELKESTVEEPVNDFEIDMSEGMVVEIFGISTFNDEVMD